jgi:hypothetical protein
MLHRLSGCWYGRRMASAAASAGARRGMSAHVGGAARPRALEPAEAAWLAAVPCALLTLALIVAIGGALGRLLLTPDPVREAFWASIGRDPQPAEHGRFLVGLVGAPLLAAAVFCSGHPHVRERLRLAPEAIRRLVLASQLLGLAFIVVCFAAQNNIVFSADFVFWPHRMYFKWPTLLLAALLPLAAWALLRGRDIGARFMAAVRETPPRRMICLAAAALYTAIWMLTAIDLDSSIGNTIEAVSGHILWTMAEPFAVLNGRTPLVNYHAQYGQLWAYLAAGPMALFGATIGGYTITLASATGLVMLAVYATFRRLVRSSLVALALYLPFLATAFFMIVGPPSNRYGPENIFILWPIRYAGPFLLAWLLARHVDGAAPRRVWALFAFAGLVAINNPDFGLAAAAGTLCALAAALPAPTRPALRRLALEALGGMLAGVALFALLTLARSGSFPHFGLLFEFSRLYGIGGWEQLPMPELGLHLVVFLTFAAAMVLAAVRVVQGARNRLLTALLAWSGVFGLIASVYYAGRAHPMALFDFFAPWAFTLVLLLLLVVPALAARGWRRPTIPELAVLFGFGLVVCSLPQTPAPWSQLHRIGNRTPTPVFKQLEAERLVAATTHGGEHVAILTTLSHRIAYDVGVVNVSPYSSIESIATAQQLQRTIDTARREGAHQLYLSLRFTRPEEFTMLQQAGYVVRRYDPTRAFVELVDRGAR